MILLVCCIWSFMIGIFKRALKREMKRHPDGASRRLERCRHFIPSSRNGLCSRKTEQSRKTSVPFNSFSEDREHQVSPLEVGVLLLTNFFLSFFLFLLCSSLWSSWGSIEQVRLIFLKHSNAFGTLSPWGFFWLLIARLCTTFDVACWRSCWTIYGECSSYYHCWVLLLHEDFLSDVPARIKSTSLSSSFDIMDIPGFDNERSLFPENEAIIHAGQFRLDLTLLNPLDRFNSCLIDTWFCLHKSKIDLILASRFLLGRTYIRVETGSTWRCRGILLWLAWSHLPSKLTSASTRSINLPFVLQWSWQFVTGIIMSMGNFQRLCKHIVFDGFHLLGLNSIVDENQNCLPR